MEIKEKNFVSAVVYVHNAEERVEKFLRMLTEVFEDNFEHSEIICVNDDSDDNSLGSVKQVSAEAKYVSISVVNMSYFHGLELAMNAGLDLSIGDFVFEFDNTIVDYGKDEIMKVYHHSLQGYDIVNAAADRRERLSSRLFYSIFDRFADRAYGMRTESFRILSRRVINRINSMTKTVPYRKVVYANSGLRADTIIYQPIADRIFAHKDKKENSYRTGLAVDSLILFTGLGYSFAVAMTVLMMLVSVFMIVYSVAIYVTAHPVEGWTTTVLFLSIAFLGLFGILTVIIKYLQLLVNLIFRRKSYSFESIEKLTR